jgi:hypothetical protein
MPETGSRCPKCDQLVPVDSASSVSGQCDFCDAASEGVRDNLKGTIVEYKRWLAEKRNEDKAAMAAISAFIANWMTGELNRLDRLVQRDVAAEITEQFGGEFTYRNKNGNLAIKEDILEAFDALTEGKVVWSKSGQYWRWRRANEAIGRRLVD